MELDYVKKQVDAILAIDAGKGKVRDPEVSHVMDDDLRETFLEALAEGSISRAQARAIARELLRTKSITRWCG